MNNEAHIVDLAAQVRQLSEAIAKLTETIHQQSNAPATKPWLEIADIAFLLNRKDSSAYKLTAQPTFPVPRIVNGRNYWKNSEVMAWLDRQHGSRKTSKPRTPLTAVSQSLRQTPGNRPATTSTHDAQPCGQGQG